MGGYYSYVNHAYEGESVQEMYGKENIERLRELKKDYDPDNRFSFYAPVTRPQKKVNNETGTSCRQL